MEDNLVDELLGEEEMNKIIEETHCDNGRTNLKTLNLLENEENLGDLKNLENQLENEELEVDELEDDLEEEDDFGEFELKEEEGSDDSDDESDFETAPKKETKKKASPSPAKKKNRKSVSPPTKRNDEKLSSSTRKNKKRKSPEKEVTVVPADDSDDEVAGPTQVVPATQEEESETKLDSKVIEEKDGKEEEEEEEVEEKAEEEEEDDDENPMEAILSSMDRNSKSLFNYFLKCNRPLSNPDLGRAMKGTKTKLEITKALEKLQEEELILQKDKVFFINQLYFGNNISEKMEKLQDKITKKKEKLEDPQEKLESFRASVHALSKQPSDSTLVSLVESKRLQVLNGEEKLGSKDTIVEQKEDESKLLARAEVGKEQLADELKFYKTFWQTRKRVATDILKEIHENLPKSKKVKFPAFCEDLGIETDQAHNISIKDFKIKF